jgi:hypothetical protein
MQQMFQNFKVNCLVVCMFWWKSNSYWIILSISVELIMVFDLRYIRDLLSSETMDLSIQNIGVLFVGGIGRRKFHYQSLFFSERSGCSNKLAECSVKISFY